MKQKPLRDILDNMFINDVALELSRAEKLHPKMHSLHEAFAVILEEVDEFKAEVWKKDSERDGDKIRAELIQIAAMAWRAARDMGVEERGVNAGAFNKGDSK